MKSNLKEPFRHITVGLQLGITIFIFVYIGYKLDTHFNMQPVFLIIGTIFGMTGGFYNLMKELNADSEKKKNDNNDNKEEKEKTRAKWM